MAEKRDVAWLDGGGGAGEMGERGRPAAQDDGEVHVRGLAGRGALAVQGVRVAVDHPQREGTAREPGAREGTGQDAAVATEHERPRPTSQRHGDRVAQRLGSGDELGGRDDAGAGVALGVTQRGHHVTRVVQPEALGETPGTQRRGSALLTATGAGRVQRRAQQQP